VTVLAMPAAALPPEELARRRLASAERALRLRAEARSDFYQKDRRDWHARALAAEAEVSWLRARVEELERLEVPA
jgi:hypothetical protein